MAKDKQCDVCGKMVSRLHGCVVYAGTETWACDDCYGYDAAAYDDEIADGIEAGDLDANGEPIPYPLYRSA